MIMLIFEGMIQRKVKTLQNFKFLDAIFVRVLQYFCPGSVHGMDNPSFSMNFASLNQDS